MSWSRRNHQLVHRRCRRPAGYWRWARDVFAEALAESETSGARNLAAPRPRGGRRRGAPVERHGSRDGGTAPAIAAPRHGLPDNRANAPLPTRRRLDDLRASRSRRMSTRPRSSSCEGGVPHGQQRAAELD